MARRRHLGLIGIVLMGMAVITADPALGCTLRCLLQGHHGAATHHHGATQDGTECPGGTVGDAGVVSVHAPTAAVPTPTSLAVSGPAPAGTVLLTFHPLRRPTPHVAADPPPPRARDPIS